MNPTAYGDLTGFNKWVWILSHLFADQKFITIFSILYGAGIVLVTQKAEEKTGRSAGLHYRRTFWLLVIGLIHAHLIWYGDILVPYALIALFVYLFRNASIRTLVITGFIFMSIHTLLYLLFGFSLPNWPPQSIEEARMSWAPSLNTINDEISAITGSLGEQIQKNSTTALFLETLVMLFFFIWRCGGLMLIGMAMFKSGFLTASKSTGFYRRGLLFGWLIGFPLIIYGIYRNFQVDWSMEYSQFFGSQFNYWGSFFVSFGYICMIMLIAKSSLLSGLKARLAAVGQMALTNYITQSLICVLIFYGVGLGLYGQFERSQQVLVVFAVWIVQILWSKPWMDKYRFGPLEWVWRSLTYMKKQVIKRQ